MGSANTQRPAFDAIFLDLDGTLVQQGRGALPGARELIEELSRSGFRLAVASAAGQGFVDAALDALGRPAALTTTRCLSDPGCEDKRAMLADLCLTFGTRSAVLMGDTSGDERAARDAGLPFVHFRGSGAPSLGPERDEVSRHVELLDLIRSRPYALEQLWTELGRPDRLGLVGAGGSGVDLLARDLAQVMESVGGERVRTVARWSVTGDRPEPSEELAALDGPLVVHGAGAAEAFGDEDLPIVEVRATPSVVAARLRAAYEACGPQAVREAFEREASERTAVARAAARRAPVAWLDGGDVFRLGRSRAAGA